MVTIRADYIPDSEAGLYFEAADFFVAPYLEGTQSGSIKLAMGYRMPIIVTHTITDHLILNYKDGLSVVKAGDILELAKLIKTTSQNAIDTHPDSRSQDDDNWQPLLGVLLR
jgi:glycosyltransferase involved in cell wall biosynthesis